MNSILEVSPFLSTLASPSDRRLNLLRWLDRHGGAMTLHDVIDAGIESAPLVRFQVADFVRDGLIVADSVPEGIQLGELDPDQLTENARLELTDSARVLLKYA